MIHHFYDEQKTANEMHEGERQLVEWLSSSHLVFCGQLHELLLMAMKAANVCVESQMKPLTPISYFAIDV
jgi:hypothetical protein